MNPDVPLSKRTGEQRECAIGYSQLKHKTEINWRLLLQNRATYGSINYIGTINLMLVRSILSAADLNCPRCSMQTKIPEGEEFFLEDVDILDELTEWPSRVLFFNDQ